jgi:hypothetical protein
MHLLQPMPPFRPDRRLVAPLPATALAVRLLRRALAAAAGAVAFTGCTGAEALDGRAAGGSADRPAILMTVSGDAVFDDRLTDRTLCRVDKLGTGAGTEGVVRGVSTASADSLVISFLWLRSGTHELVQRGYRPGEPALSIMATVAGTIYQWAPGGKATVTIRDRVGKSGTIVATGFKAFERFEDVPANLSLKVSWKCD